VTTVTGLYAKTRLSIQFFFVFTLALFLTGCVADGYSSGRGHNSGVVSNDPNAMPNLAWQTGTDRRELSQQSQQFRPGLVNAGPVEKVRVALLLPLTGKNTDLGQSMLKAAQMALFDVGSANFVLNPRDTKSTPEGAAAAASAAVANGDQLILGPIFADDVKAARPAAGGLPMIAFTTDWKIAGGNTYIMGFLPFAQVSRVAQFAQSKGIERFGVFAPQTEYCDVVISTLRSSADIDKAGRYMPQQTDLTDIVKQFIDESKTADGTLRYQSLMLPVGGESLRSLMSVFSLNGINNKSVKLVGTGLWDDTSLTRDPALYGGWFAAPDPKLRADFDRRYQENYGATPLRLASLAYDATALAAVLARTSPEAPYSRGNITNGRGFAGIDGIFRFRGDGLAERGLAVLEIQSGHTRVVDPAPTAFLSGS
jgi:branched-chain amino acid transport system substrate-binding protein